MKCPICQKELEIKNKKVGENEAGEAIFNEYGICHDCKKQWNLDKHRAKKAAAQKNAVEEPAAEKPIEKNDKKPAEKPVVKTVKKEKTVSDVLPERPKKKVRRPAVDAVAAADKAVVKEVPVIELPSESAAVPVARPKKKRPRPVMDDATKVLDKLPNAEDFQASPAPKVKAEGSAVSEELKNSTEMPRKKKRRPAPEGAASAKRPGALEETEDAPRRKPIDNRKEEQTFSNIPPKHIREAREKEMRENYQLMVDEDDEDEGSGFPVALIVILVILLLAAAAFAGYWFFLR